MRQPQRDADQEHLFLAANALIGVQNDVSSRLFINLAPLIPDDGHHQAIIMTKLLFYDVRRIRRTSRRRLQKQFLRQLLSESRFRFGDLRNYARIRHWNYLHKSARLAYNQSTALKTSLTS